MDFLPTSLAEVPLNQIVFYVLAFVAVVSALQVVLQKSPLYAALNLIVTLVSLALIFAQLSAGFLAAVQVIVYAGAIVVLFIFIIMLLNLTDDGGREFRAVPMKVVGAPRSAGISIAVAILRSSRPRRLLPIPELPWMATMRPLPCLACSSTCVRCETVGSRPTSGAGVSVGAGASTAAMDAVSAA